jgi:hypothetical protein
MANSVCVVVSHVEKDEWALVLTAQRKGERRIFTPFLFAFSDIGLFASCPNTDLWARSGLIRIFKADNRTADVRRELLKNAVDDALQGITQCSRVLEYRRVGIVQKLLSTNFNDALPDFDLGAEYAFRWLFEHKSGTNAVAAMRVCRYLADKHNIGRLSPAEIEELTTYKVLKG